MTLTSIGAIAFGLVVGYITYRTLVRTTEKTAISDLTAVLGAIGGGLVTTLYEPTSNTFAWYSIGLAVGMVVYFALFGLLNGRGALADVMGRTDRGNSAYRHDGGYGPQA